MKKLFGLIFLVAFLFIPVTAYASSMHVSGGDWNYGVSKGRVYSNYHHSTKKHGASVINYNGDKDYDYHVKPGKVAKASLPSGWGTDSSYYQIG